MVSFLLFTSFVETATHVLARQGVCISQEGCGSLPQARWLDCWNPAASSKLPVLRASAGCLATPARASPSCQAPRLLLLHPVAMGTSTLQLTEQLAWCLFFSFYLGLIFPFISWAPSLPSTGTQSSGQGYLFGMMRRLLTLSPQMPPTFLQPSPAWGQQPSSTLVLNASRQLDLFLMGRGEKTERNPRCVSGERSLFLGCLGACPHLTARCYQLFLERRRLSGAYRPLAPRPRWGCRVWVVWLTH